MNISHLIGKTLKSCEKIGDGEIRFTEENGKQYRLFHQQDCCENVTVEDIAGNLSDLVGSPILNAEESTNSSAEPKENSDSHTWTFYRIHTAKGPVVIRFYGESNGYYSESVDFEEVAL